jgi:Cu/Ag efflux pump CusA
LLAYVPFTPLRALEPRQIDPFQVALLTLAALAVGMMVPVMFQVWLTLRKVQSELTSMHARIDPMLNEVQAVVAQVRSATLVTSAIAAAVTAGVGAWRESRQNAVSESP